MLRRRLQPKSRAMSDRDEDHSGAASSSASASSSRAPAPKAVGEMTRDEMAALIVQMQAQMQTMGVPGGNDENVAPPEEVVPQKENSAVPNDITVRRPKDRPHEGGLWWEETTEWLENQRSAATRRGYRSTLCVLDAVLEHSGVNLSDPEKIHLNLAIIRKLEKYFKDTVKSTKTRNQYMSNIKSLCTYLRRKGVIRNDLSFHIFLDKATVEEQHNETKRVPLTEEELDSMWAYIPPEKSRHYDRRTFRLLLALMYRFGLRVSEVMKVKCSQIDVVDDRIVRLGYNDEDKLFGKREKRIQLSANMSKEDGTTDRYVEHILMCKDVLDDGYLFPVPDKRYKTYGSHVTSRTGRRWIALIAKGCGIRVDEDRLRSSVHPHLLRHTIATDLMKKPGVKKEFVATWLRHSSTSMTDRYINLTNVPSQL